MNTIQININTQVNPCILTKDGEYVPRNHQIYVSCNAKQTNLYSKYGWYLGSIFITSPDLVNIEKGNFSELLKQIENESNLVITDSKDNLKSHVFIIVNSVVDKLNEQLCLVNPIKISNNYLKF